MTPKLIADFDEALDHAKEAYDSDLSNRTGTPWRYNYAAPTTGRAISLLTFLT